MKRNELNRNLIKNFAMANASTVAREWETTLSKVKQSAMRELRKAFNDLVRDFEDNTFIPFGDVEELSLNVIDYGSGEAEAVEVDGVYVRKNGDMIDIEVDTWNGCSNIGYYCTDDIINILSSSIEYIGLFMDGELPEDEECKES